MCGIAGLVEFENQVADLSTLMEKMGDAIRHRGPDASGVYSDSSVGLVHRRLSIIDLNETGSQPMSSPSGRFVIVFNGEIYNFKILRSQLEEEGISFNGTSDTEVLIALYEKYGSDCLSMLNGMFAIAVWDKKEQSLFLARDRLGKKPLYYYYDQKKFLFASEIKAILCDEAVDRTLRSDAIKDYFFYQYVPDPKTIFKNIQKLRPGHWLRFDRSGIVQTQYWDLSFVKSHGGSQVQIEEDLVELLDDSVRL